MDLQLHNKLALITASSGGIGLAIAETLAAEGARVIINGRNEGTVSSAIAQLSNNLPEARFLPLAADNGTAEGTAKTIAAFPEVDILVNNLGIYEARVALTRRRPTRCPPNFDGSTKSHGR